MTEPINAGFLAWVKILPAPVQQNIIESAERGESYTYRAWQEAVAQERERCAYICDRWSGVGDVVARAIAAAIRRWD